MPKGIYTQQKGHVPLEHVRAHINKVVAPSGETAWTITYCLMGANPQRLLGRGGFGHPVREDRVEGGLSLFTTKGRLPSRELEIEVKHSETPCGVCVAIEFFYRGEMVRRDIRQEVYEVEGATGGAGL